MDAFTTQRIYKGRHTTLNHTLRGGAVEIAYVATGGRVIVPAAIWFSCPVVEQMAVAS